MACFVLALAVAWCCCLAGSGPGAAAVPVVGNGAGSDGADRPASAQLPYGDPRRCPGASTGAAGPLLLSEALPGGGWDNLRNRPAGLVLAINYTECHLTADGRYLLPDSIFAVPVKSSRVDTYADLFTHWSNYTSTLSHGINAHAGLTLHNVGISGQFSDEFRSVKSSQYMESTDTVRVQARYVRYIAQLMSGARLQSAFKRRLSKIAAMHELNRTEEATYLSQLLVRDFGTHVVTSVDLGAALVQQDQILKSYVRKYSSSTSQVKASAGVSFFHIFSIGFGGGTASSQTAVEEYTKSRTSSEISTHGGPAYKPANFTANDWLAGLDPNLVAVDRSGDPLYSVITSANLPKIPASTVRETRASVQQAVELYYRHNTYYGCTKRGRPNFSFTANADDGSCKPQLTNYTFGGLYQTCQGGGVEDLCEGRRQVNPLTGGYTCPPEYQSVLLSEGSLSHTSTRHSCHRCWLVATCCHDDHERSTASFSAHWCAAVGRVDQQMGYLFGGVFTSTVFNPLTQTKACPPRFYPLKVLDDLSVCVSDDYELAAADAVPFAGFYSCRAGNPLAVGGGADAERSARPYGGAGRLSLARYAMDAGPTGWPHACPRGFSQHLATVDPSGCEVNYCARSGALSPAGLPPVQRPPFMPPPSGPDDQDRGEVRLMADGSLWEPLTDASSVDDDGVAADGRVSGPGGGGMSGGGIAAVTIIVIALVVVVLALSAVLYRRKRREQVQAEPARDQSPSDEGDDEDTRLLM